MGKHHKTDLDKARDELMSHVIRCDVLDASMDDRMEWLSDTMDFMAERYPQLGDLEIAQLEMIGRQFMRPAIPHGAGHTAQSRGRPTEDAVEPAEPMDPAEPAAETAPAGDDEGARDAA